jgi:PAS domain S-box-containing protein
MGWTMRVLAFSAACGLLAASVVRLAQSGVSDLATTATLGVIAGALLLVAAMSSARAPRRRSVSGVQTAETILAAFPEAVLVIEDGTVTAANRKLCALLSAEPDALIGMREPYSFWPPEHRHRHESCQRHLDEHGSVEAELVIRRTDGQRIPVLVSGSLVSIPVDGRTTQVMSFRDITQRRLVEDRLAALASRDPLTELLNEWGFQERLSEEVGRARAAGRALSIVLVQFDGLATQGDLAAAIQRFRGDLRAGEQISRTNETELAWILPEVDAAGAISAVARAVAHVSQLEGDWLGSVRVSAGVCELGADHDAAVLYAFANRALRAASAQGGGTVVYSPDVTQLAR